jgi:two-component system KDP operon response regulator KdpE
MNRSRRGTRTIRRRRHTRLLEQSELSARIGRALQLTPFVRGDRLMLGEMCIDFGRGHVVAPGRSMHLTTKEFNLLAYMVVHANKVLSTRELLQAVWGPEYGTEHARLQVLVNQLRKKIETRPSSPEYLVTVSHAGYQLLVPCGPERTNLDKPHDTS